MYKSTRGFATVGAISSSRLVACGDHQNRLKQGVAVWRARHTATPCSTRAAANRSITSPLPVHNPEPVFPARRQCRRMRLSGRCQGLRSNPQGLALTGEAHEDANLSAIAWPGFGFPGFGLWLATCEACCLPSPLGGQWVKTRRSVRSSALSSPWGD